MRPCELGHREKGRDGAERKTKRERRGGKRKKADTRDKEDEVADRLNDRMMVKGEMEGGGCDRGEKRRLERGEKEAPDTQKNREVN